MTEHASQDKPAGVARKVRRPRRVFGANAALALALAAVAPGAAHAQLVPSIQEYSVGSGPTAIASGPDTDLWFGQYNDGSGGQVGRISIYGQYLPIANTAGTGPYGAIADGQGNVWVSLRSTYQLLCLTPIAGDTRHATVKTIDISPGSGPAEMAMGPGGELWWTEPASGVIARMTPTCTTGPATLMQPVTVTDAHLSVGEPGGIVQGADGNMWFTDYSNNAIGRIAPNATASSDLTEYPLPNGGEQPAGIAVGPDGRIWFTEDAGNRVGSISTDGTYGPDIALPLADSHPGGIAAGPDGNLWFTESGTQRVGWISPSTNTLLGELQFTSSFYPAIGWSPSVTEDHITTGPDGNLWFTETAQNIVGEVSFHAPPPPPGPGPAPNVLLGHGPSSDSTATSTSTSSSSGAPQASVAAVSALTIRPTVFRAARSGPTASAARKASSSPKKTGGTGANVSYRLNVAAAARFTVSRLATGRLSKARSGRCVAATSSNRRHRACVLVKVIGVFAVSGRSAVRSFHFSGRLAGRSLAPGSYRLLLTPIAPGRAGRGRSAAFRIRR